MLDAVTGREWAKAVTGLERSETEVEPLSNYLVGRAERELGRRGAVGALATAVNRDLRAPALRAELPAQSYVGGIDGHVFLDAKRDWVITGGHLREPSHRQHGGDHAPAERSRSATSAGPMRPTSSSTRRPRRSTGGPAA